MYIYIYYIIKVMFITPKKGCGKNHKLACLVFCENKASLKVLESFFKVYLILAPFQESDLIIHIRS